MVTKEFAIRYATSGNVIFTLKSPKTGRRFTYNIIKNTDLLDTYEIRLLQGDDNEKDYHFIGRYYDSKFENKSLWIKDSGWYKDGEDVDWNKIHLYSYRAIIAFFIQTKRFLNTFEFYPSDRCAKCGRLLTDPESIKFGLGPKCGKRR